MSTISEEGHNSSASCRFVPLINDFDRVVIVTRDC